MQVCAGCGRATAGNKYCQHSCEIADMQEQLKRMRVMEAQLGKEERHEGQGTGKTEAPEV